MEVSVAPQKVCEVRRLRSPVRAYSTKKDDFLYFRIFKMILIISKYEKSIPGKISDRPRWSKIFFENYFKSEKFSKEVERVFFRLQIGFIIIRN